MTWPNFLIIGAPKCGTTSLHKYLSQHPQIFMSANKEPHFFAYEGKMPDFRGPGDDRAGTNTHSVVHLRDYQALFEGAAGAIAIGEASTMYLYHLDAPAHIHHYIPEVKLIAFLRHPVDRAFSHYLHLRNDGRERLEDFREALEAESDRISQHYAPAWHYRQVSLYAPQITRYLDRFAPEQIRFYLYEDFKHNPQAIVREIFQFLGVDATQLPNMGKRYNVSGQVRKSSQLHDFLVNENPIKSLLRPLVPAKLRQKLGTQLYHQNVKPAPRLDPRIRQEIFQSFKADIAALEQLLQRDLSLWSQG